MARGDQLARQWKIIQILSSSKTGKSASELASELDCHPRTVYRDLEALQDAGFPIYTDRVESKSLWSLLDTMKHQIPIPFSLPELMALYFATDMLKVFRGTVFHDSLESLSKKIKTTLPPKSVKYLKNMEHTLQIGIKPYKRYKRFKELINQVNEAALKRKTLQMVYYTMSRKKESQRKVDPYKVWFFNGSFYLIGYCHKRQEVRIFAIDRIKMLHQTKETFEVIEDFDFDTFMGPGLGVFVGKPVRLKIWFSSQVAGYIKEKIWHDTQKILEQKDGSIIFEADVANTAETRSWIMSWGANAHVLEPEELREEIRKEAERISETYAGNERIEQPLSTR